MKVKPRQAHPKSILHTQPMQYEYILSELALCTTQYAALVACICYFTGRRRVHNVFHLKKYLLGIFVLFSIHRFIHPSLCPDRHKCVNEFDFRHRQTAEFEVI